MFPPSPIVRTFLRVVSQIFCFWWIPPHAARKPQAKASCRYSNLPELFLACERTLPVRSTVKCPAISRVFATKDPKSVTADRESHAPPSVFDSSHFTNST